MHPPRRWNQKRRIQKRWIPLALATATTLILTGCAGSEDDPADPTHLTIAENTAVTYDPLHGGAGYWATPAIQAVYDTLLMWDQTDDSFDPWLASGYTLSEDKTVMDMTLRDDVDFIDGEHLDAEAVVKFLTLVRDTPTQSVSFVNLGAEGYGAEFEVTGEYSLRITTTKPIDHAIFQVLDTSPVPSPAALDDPDSLNTTPVGTGPYILDEENSTPGVELNYTRNEDYWNPDVYPYDTLTIKTFEDSVAALNALKSGQIDATAVDIGAAQEAEDSGFALTIASGSFITIRFLDLEGQLTPAVGDVRVRQAINMAIDRAAINDVISLGYGGVSDQGFIAGQPTYLEGQDEYYSFDPERAKELLAEAGFPDGFELRFPSFTPSLTNAIEPIVQQSLSDIGITVVYDPFVDGGEWFAAIPNYSAILYQEAYVNTVTNVNTGGFLAGWGVDAEMSDLARQLELGDETERAEAGRKLGELFLHEAWLAPVSEVVTSWAAIPEVEITLEALVANVRLQFFKPAE